MFWAMQCDQYEPVLVILPYLSCFPSFPTHLTLSTHSHIHHTGLHAHRQQHAHRAAVPVVGRKGRRHGTAIAADPLLPQVSTVRGVCVVLCLSCICVLCFNGTLPRCSSFMLVVAFPGILVGVTLSLNEFSVTQKSSPYDQ